MKTKIVIGCLAAALLLCGTATLVGGLGVYAFLRKDDGVLVPVKHVAAGEATRDIIEHPSNYQGDLTPAAYALLLRVVSQPQALLPSVVKCAYPERVIYAGTTARVQVALVVRIPNGQQLLDVANYHLVQQNGQWRLADLGRRISLADVSGNSLLANCTTDVWVYPPTPTVAPSQTPPRAHP